MHLEVSKEKLLLVLFFILVFVCLAGGIYFERKKREQGKVSFDDPSGQDIFADISGAVTSPGVYQLPAGSRVTDLLRVCGGVLDNVSIEWLSKNLNLSDKLTDSQKIYMPFDWEVHEYTSYKIAPLEAPATGKVADTDTGSDEETPAGDALINVNKATQAELEELPGIGEVTAKKIIDNRPYVDIDDLSEKASLSKSVIEKIQKLVSF